MNQDSSERAVGGRRRAELLADIAASAIPYRGPLRDVSEFRELAALYRPSILRRAATDLAAEVPQDVGRLVAAGWRATVLATALSLHTGLPLCVMTDPATAPDGGLATGQSVALVVGSTTGDSEVASWVIGLEEHDVHVETVLSLLATGPRHDTATGTGTRPLRVGLLTEEELAASTTGGRP